MCDNCGDFYRSRVDQMMDTNVKLTKELLLSQQLIHCLERVMSYAIQLRNTCKCTDNKTLIRKNDFLFKMYKEIKKQLTDHKCSQSAGDAPIETSVVSDKCLTNGNNKVGINVVQTNDDILLNGNQSYDMSSDESLIDEQPLVRQQMPSPINCLSEISFDNSDKLLTTPPQLSRRMVTRSRSPAIPKLDKMVEFSDRTSPLPPLPPLISFTKTTEISTQTSIIRKSPEKTRSLTTKSPEKPISMTSKFTEKSRSLTPISTEKIPQINTIVSNDETSAMESTEYDMSIDDTDNTHNIDSKNNNIDVQDISFKCGHKGCPFRCRRRKTFNQHVLTHRKFTDSDHPYQCQVGDCSSVFKSKIYLKQHELTFHPEIYPEAKWYTCHVRGCHYRSKSYHVFFKHKRQHRERAYAYPCPICSHRFTTRNTLNRHIKDNSCAKRRTDSSEAP